MAVVSAALTDLADSGLMRELLAEHTGVCFALSVAALRQPCRVVAQRPKRSVRKGT